jgi:hypothetical protein
MQRNRFAYKKVTFATNLILISNYGDGNDVDQAYFDSASATLYKPRPG